MQLGPAGEKQLGGFSMSSTEGVVAYRSKSQVVCICRLRWPVLDRPWKFTVFTLSFLGICQASGKAALNLLSACGVSPIFTGSPFHCEMLQACRTQEWHMGTLKPKPEPRHLHLFLLSCDCGYQTIPKCAF